MTSTAGADTTAGPRLEIGPYIVRTLLHDIPLSADGEEENVRITCVEAWSMPSCSRLHYGAANLAIGDNLYVGTSAGEILHHVRISGETDDSPPQYILAYRLRPPVNQPGEAGIQQILLLPAVNKLINQGNQVFPRSLN